jgi:hypothetical protein
MVNFPSPLTRLLQLRPYEVELLHPRRNVPPLAWVLLVAGGAAIGAAMLACQPAWDHRAELAADEIRLQSALERLGGETHTAGRSRSGAIAGEGDALAEAQLVVADAHRPWHDLFNQLEAAQKAQGTGVHLVQLGIDPRFATIQVVAEGRDLGKLVRFAQQLPGNGPIRTMSLTHHEWRDTLGAHVVTASLQGELDAAVSGAVADGNSGANAAANAVSNAVSNAVPNAGANAGADAGADAGANTRATTGAMPGATPASVAASAPGGGSGALAAAGSAAGSFAEPADQPAPAANAGSAAARLAP